MVLGAIAVMNWISLMCSPFLCGPRPTVAQASPSGADGRAPVDTDWLFRLCDGLPGKAGAGVCELTLHANKLDPTS